MIKAAWSFFNKYSSTERFVKKEIYIKLVSICRYLADITWEYLPSMNILE